ncbi:MAG: ribosome assembly factor SBDS [Methanomassiliicoccales archaeon]
MVSIEDSVIARMDSHGESFEVLIDPQAARELREGKEVDLSQNLAVEEIFRDAKKGDRSSEEKMEEVFGTNEVLEVAKEIVLKGEVQLTTEQRRQMQEEKKRRIVAEIARNAINPQSGTPHPPQRIEMAMDEAKVHIDPFKSVDAQISHVLDKLKPLIPIRFETSQVAVKLSGEDYGRCYEILTDSGKVVKEEWQPTGDWIGVVEVPAGMRDEFISQLNNRTHGAVETKLLK